MGGKGGTGKVDAAGAVVDPVVAVTVVVTGVVVEVVVMVDVVAVWAGPPVVVVAGTGVG